MTSFAAFPALMPHFFEAWNLSGTQAGWINGAYFLGFTIFGLLASAVTDRIDARSVVLVGHVVAIAGAAGFAFLSHDFATALPWRFLSGAALACAYMPGLKMLNDRIPALSQARAIAFYTACFSTGSAFSFLIVGLVNDYFDPQSALVVAASGPPLALILVLLLNRPLPVLHPRPWKHIFNFMPVLKNRVTMGYVTAYFCHSWELMAMRSFVVAFLTFAATQSAPPEWLSVSLVSSVVIFMGLPASVLGNEFSLKFGRRPSILVIMAIAFVLAILMGFSIGAPFWIVAILAIMYGFFVTADSSSITSGAVTSAPEKLKGSTMAVHSFVGFGGAMAGPVIAGIVLDLAGGRSDAMAWGFTYLSMASIAILTPIAFKIAR